MHGLRITFATQDRSVEFHVTRGIEVVRMIETYTELGENMRSCGLLCQLGVLAFVANEPRVNCQPLRGAAALSFLDMLMKCRSTTAEAYHEVLTPGLRSTAGHCHYFLVNHSVDWPYSTRVEIFASLVYS